MLQGEVPLGLVRAGLLPAWFGRTNRADVATVPLVIASSLTIALLLIGGWGSGARVMEFMVLLTSVSGIWIYVFACLAALVLRLMRLRAGLSLLFLAAVLWGAGWQAVALGAALLVAALPFYFLATRGAVIAQPSTSSV